MADEAGTEVSWKLLETLANIAATQAQIADTMKALGTVIVAMRDEQHQGMAQIHAQLVKLAELIEARHTMH